MGEVSEKSDTMLTFSRLISATSKLGPQKPHFIRAPFLKNSHIPHQYRQQLEFVPIVREDLNFKMVVVSQESDAIPIFGHLANWDLKRKV